MAEVRAFLGKYWIIIVVVLWVIAWSGRDWLAGGVHPTGVVVAEDPAQSVVDAGAADVAVAPVTSEREPAEVVAVVAAPEAQATRPAAPVPATSTTAVPERAPVPAPAPTVAATSAESTESAPAAMLRTPAIQESVAQGSVAQGSVAQESVAAMPSATAVVVPVAPPGPVAEEQEARTRSAEEILGEARAAYRRGGAKSAADVLVARLAVPMEDQMERATLYGHLGNFYIEAGDYARALTAFDLALMALPAAERARRIQDLAPFYERYHPLGRSYLGQFR